MRMKKIILTLLIGLSMCSVVEAQDYFYKRAVGLFMSFGVGPRIPLGTAAEMENLAAGLDVTVSYADNEILPFFVYSKVGYQHFPGRQSFYEDTDYSSYSNNTINLDFGARYFFPAIVEDIVLLMPVVELGPSLAFMERLHQFKAVSGKDDVTDDTTYLGFHIGAGFSMFMLDVMANYHYFYHNQFLSFNFIVRLPIFVRL